MASAPAGKFQDHYSIFGVEPKASTDEIYAAYSKQIELYHPERGREPNKEKFEAANLAWEVLSDPEGRKAFDGVRGGGHEDDAEVSFTGMSFFANMRFDIDRRNTILVVLYDHKRQKPRTPAITRRQLDMLIQMTEEDVQLAVWYLKDRGLMVVDDRSKMQITAAGMDYLQGNLPDPQTVVPFLKQLRSAEEVAPAPAMPELASLATNIGPSSVVPATPEPAAAKPLNIVRRTINIPNQRG